MKEEEKVKTGRREFSAEFKAEAVRLVTSGERTQAEAARNLGIGSSTINKWCRESVQTGKSAENRDSDEVTRLKAEVRRLKLEQEILKKAAAYFAKNLM